jgi:hypothetical protein
MRGFGVPWHKWTASNVIADAQSSYTQQGPQPGTATAGDARSKLLPVVLGTQGVDLDHAVSRTGAVGGRWDRALAVAARPTGASTWRGWEGPGTVTWFAPILSTGWSTGSSTVPSAICRLRSGRVLMAWFVGVFLYSSRVDPRDLSRTLATVNGSVNTPSGVTLTVLPDGRVLLIARFLTATADNWYVYYSDDEGTTWTLYDAAPFEGQTAATLTTASVLPMAWAANDRGEVLFLRTDFTDCAQVASSALGASLGLVGLWSTDPPQTLSLCALSTGGWIVAYVVAGGTAVRVRRIGSATSPIESVAAVTVVTAASSDACVWESTDGRIWVLATGAGIETRLYYSDDGGGTWTANQTAGRFGGDCLRQGDTSTKIKHPAAVEAGGAVYVAHHSTDASGGTVYDATAKILRLGGWEDVEHSGGYVGSGESTQWVPWETPDTIATWAPTGAGTAALGVSGVDGMRITTSANTKFWQDTFSAGFRSYVALIDVTMVSGGSTASNVVSVRIFGGDGANSVQCDLRISTTAIALIEGSVAVTLGTATFATTTRFQAKIQVLYSGSGTAHTVSAWWRRPSETVWTLVATGAMTATALPTAPFFQWGHRANTTSVSVWHGVSVATTNTRTGLGTINGAPAALLGRAFPEASSSSVASLLAVRQGPGRVTETHTIARTYEYPLDMAFPEVSPSPTARGWRSVNAGSAVNLAVSQTLATNPGNWTAYLYIGGANFRTAYLQTWSGFSWTTIGTWDAATGFVSLPYQRTGDNLRPDYIGGAAGARYLQHSELVGGTVLLPGARYRRIVRQTEGRWTQGPDADKRAAMLWMDGEDGSSTTFSTCDIWWPSGVLVVPNISPSAQGFRVQIPAQTTYDGDLRAGIIQIGGVHPVGRRWGRGGQIGYEQAIDTNEDAYGTERIRERGPRRRVASFAWADPVDLTTLRAAGPGNFFNADSGLPLAEFGDVPWLLDGIMRETKSGERPIVWLPVIPTTATMITDPTLYLYGRARVGETTQALGLEGSSELVRVSEMQIKEIA